MMPSGQPAVGGADVTPPLCRRQDVTADTALPLVVAGVVRLPLLGAEPKLQPPLPLTTGVILYATCRLTHADPYLAAFSADAVMRARVRASQ